MTITNEEMKTTDEFTLMLIINFEKIDVCSVSCTAFTVLKGGKLPFLKRTLCIPTFPSVMSIGSKSCLLTV